MYDSYTGRFMQEDPIGFDAGDVNLYRYVKNSPTNATDPSGLQPNPWETDTVRQSLDISGRTDRTFVRRVVGLLDTQFRLARIPVLSPNTPAPAFVQIGFDQSSWTLTPYFMEYHRVPAVTYAERARISIRVNLINLKQSLVTQIFAMLSANPPRTGIAADARLTTRDDWSAAANNVADAYILAVDDFLRTHPGARPRLGQRNAVEDFLGILNENNAPWCADWALGISTSLRNNPHSNGNIARGALTSANHFQIRFRDQGEHNIVILSAVGRAPQVYPNYDTAVLIIDPWLDLLPRAYVPGALNRTHVPTTQFQRVERDRANEPELPAR